MLTQKEIEYYRNKWITNLDKSLKEEFRDRSCADGILIHAYKTLFKHRRRLKRLK